MLFLKINTEKVLLTLNFYILKFASDVKIENIKSIISVF